MVEEKSEKIEMETKEETKEVVKQEAKQETKKVVKKTEAIVRGQDLPISLKHAMAICNFIRGKKINEMIKELERVPTFKRIIPMNGEIPHRKGKILSGRYPIKASKVFIKLLKNLRANAQNVGINSENLVIRTAVANKAPQPRHFSGRWSGSRKRCHVEMIAYEKTEILSRKKEKK